ncbi:MAG: hypothetical protein ABI882_19540 [Acidobacteriota bacterium]
MSTPHASETLLSPWSLLTDSERCLLVGKLIMLPSTIDIGDNHLRAAGQRFDAALAEPGASAETEALLIPDRILTLRNFMYQAGAAGSGSWWKHVARLKGVRHSYLELTVHNRAGLLQHLRSAGFVINREPFWSSHKFDSARAVTRFSREPSLHLANDRAEEPAYGPNYFFVHWDVTSVWFEESTLWYRRLPGARIIERIRAGLKHQSGLAQCGIVESYLAKRDLDPPGDFV